MSNTLTAEQLAWENKWLDGLDASSASRDPETWIKFYKKDATLFIASTGQTCTGLDEIKGNLTQMGALFAFFSHTNQRRIFDPSQNLIIVLADAAIGLNADPDKTNKVHTKACAVITKELGVQQEQMDREEVLTNLAPVMARLAELMPKPSD